MQDNYEDALQLANFEEKNSQINISKDLGYIHSNLKRQNITGMNLKLEQVRELFELHCIELSNSRDPLIQCGKERCSINSLGEVTICEKLADISFGNITEQSLKEIWEEKKIDNFLETCKMDLKCIDYSVKNYCYRCNGISFLETGHPGSSVEQLCNLAEGVKSIFEEKISDR